MKEKERCSLCGKEFDKKSSLSTPEGMGFCSKECQTLDMLTN